MNIGLIGVGKLGLAYALIFEQRGFSVWASSYKQTYIQELKSRTVHTSEPGIKSLLSHSQINFTTDNHELIRNCDFIYVLVATPSHDKGDYDISAVQAVAQDLLDHPDPVRGKTLVIGSTVNPGTCEHLQQMLSQREISVAYCPTFAAQGTVLRDIQNPNTLSIGTTESAAAKQCQLIFRQIIPDDTPIYTMHPRTAEILKLAGNCRATLHISFANMIGQMLLSQGLTQDMDCAMQYLNFIKCDNRWNFGFGFGGPCYPRDNRSMVYWATTQGLDYPLGVLIDQFNQQHVDFLTEWLLQDNRLGLPFYFDFISYKPGVAIFEESHQLKVAQNLLQKKHCVYVAKSEFLTEEKQTELVNEFGDLIAFSSLANLDAKGISVYRVMDRL